jgi:hypothetical protein
LPVHDLLFVFGHDRLELCEVESEDIVEDAVELLTLLERRTLRHLAREQNELADTLQEILFTDPEELSLSLCLQFFRAE